MENMIKNIKNNKIQSFLFVFVLALYATTCLLEIKINNIIISKVELNSHLNNELDIQKYYMKALKLDMNRLTASQKEKHVTILKFMMSENDVMNKKIKHIEYSLLTYEKLNDILYVILKCLFYIIIAYIGWNLYQHKKK